MAKIFICYRREDSKWPAQWIYNALTNHFGSESVVFDVDTIPLGKDFREYLNKQVSECDILLAIIGDQWIDILTQRLDDPKDFVRIEIQAALKRDIPVVPILVGKASVPSEENLPPELAGLSYKHAAEVRAGADLQAHLKRLINGLDRLLAERKAEEDRKRKETEAKRKEKPRSDIALKVTHQKRLTFGIGAVTLIVILSVIGWFLYSKPPYAKTFKNSIGMKFIKIPAGSFTMGSKLSPDEIVQKYGGADLSEWYKGEHPQHSVKITKPFYIQTIEVTQGQWITVMGDRPSYFKSCGDNCPVERVSWEDAHKFIKKLNEMEGDEAYRLPTEAEWEYACRAGTTTVFSFGDDMDKLTDYAWIELNSDSKTHQVATKKPNPWGLYDMHGNVYEWVEDDWHDNYDGAPNDGRAWVDDPRRAARVFRGGSWGSDALFCRLAIRSGSASGRGDDLGFRLARSVALGP